MTNAASANHITASDFGHGRTGNDFHDTVIALLRDAGKRLALGALVAFYGINGRRLTLTNDAAYELIMQVAVGELDSVDEIAAILEKSTGAVVPPKQ
jgi:hypothetical protein